MSRKDKFKRQCIICREYKDKKDLIRVTKNHLTDIAEINMNNDVFGRSVYICNNPECIDKAVKKGRINTLLNVKSIENIENKLYSFLKNSTL